MAVGAAECSVVSVITLRLDIAGLKTYTHIEAVFVQGTVLNLSLTIVSMSTMTHDKSVSVWCHQLPLTLNNSLSVCLW